MWHLSHLHRFIPQFAQICTRENSVNLVQINCFVQCMAECINLVQGYTTQSILTNMKQNVKGFKYIPHLQFFNTENAIHYGGQNEKGVG